MPKTLTYKSYGSGKVWLGNLPAHTNLTSNPINQLNGYAGPREGIYIRHGFLLIAFGPVINQIMRLISQSIQKPLALSQP